MRIETGGDAGIGTTNPTQKLHVAGKGLFTGGLLVQEEGIESTGFLYTGLGPRMCMARGAHLACIATVMVILVTA